MGDYCGCCGAFVLGCVASIGTQMIFEGKSLGEVNGAEVIMSGVTTFMSFWGVNPVAQAIIGGVGEVWSCAAEGESLEVAVCNIGVGWIAGKLLKKIGIVEAKGLKQLTKDYNMHIKEVRDVNLGAIESIPYYIREQKIYDNATKRLGRYSMEYYGANYVANYGTSKAVSFVVDWAKKWLVPNNRISGYTMN